MPVKHHIFDGEIGLRPYIPKILTNYHRMISNYVMHVAWPTQFSSS
jgi:hypothetical protein